MGPAADKKEKVMILIEVYIPVLQENYEFKADETRPVYDIVSEMRQVISRKLREEDPPVAFELHSREQRRRLPPDNTLSGCGVGDGARLILL